MTTTPSKGIIDKGWDTTTDPLNPQPYIYPVCPDCEEAWVYTRCLSFTTGNYVWCWMRPHPVTKGCRHKGHPQMQNDHEKEGEGESVPQPLAP